MTPAQRDRLVTLARRLRGFAARYAMDAEQAEKRGAEPPAVREPTLRSRRCREDAEALEAALKALDER